MSRHPFIDKVLKEIATSEQQFPILKQTDASFALFVRQVEHARSQRELIETLEVTPICVAITTWLTSLKTGTRQAYAYGISSLLKRSIIPEKDAVGKPFTIGHFRHVPHERQVDRIKLFEDLAENTKQFLAACYISFTGYLQRLTHGWFRKAIPSTSAANPTFFNVYDKCTTNALTLTEWHRFINALQDINYRDALIARCMFQGAKRISETLALTTDQIDWEKNIITFTQSKTGGRIKKIPITYPPYFMDELKKYIHKGAPIRKGKHVFITRNGKPVTRARLNYSFNKARQKALLKPKVTPHTLRATWVTLVKKMGVQDTEIMKVTGHTSSKMIYAYDKTSDEDNYTKELFLI